MFKKTQKTPELMSIQCNLVKIWMELINYDFADTKNKTIYSTKEWLVSDH